MNVLNESPRQEMEPIFALLADGVAGSAELTRSALAVCGATAVAVTSASDILSPLPQGRQPDLVIVDQDFGGRGLGLRLVESAMRLSSASIIVIGSDFEGAEIGKLADRCHLLHRPVHGGQLRTTIRLALAQRALRGEQPGESRRHLHLVERSRPARSMDDLRPRERDIARLLLQHCRVPAVARTLGISPHTVRNHLKHIYRRLDVHSQQELLDVLKLTEE